MPARYPAPPPQDTPTFWEELTRVGKGIGQSFVDTSRAGLLGYQQALTGYTPEGEAVGSVLPLRYEEGTGKVTGFATPRLLEVWNTAGGPAGSLGAGVRTGVKRAADTEHELLQSGLLDWAREPHRVSDNVTGTFDPTDDVPLLYKGKGPKDWTPEDFEAVGNELGVERLGPASPAKTYHYSDGGTFDIPGGLTGKFTYYDMLSMKAAGIDASRVPQDIGVKLQKKMVRSVGAAGDPTPEQTWAGLAFGMTSPNQPLTANELAMSRLRINSPEDLDRIANMVPWKVGDEVPKEVRLAASADMKRQLGLAKAEEGGIGAGGTIDYTRLAEMAQLFKEDPDWFKKAPGEHWSRVVERVASQVPGFSTKTGTFGLVWQNPEHAAISAIDRHMANIFKDVLFENPEARQAFEDRALALWNKKHPSKAKNRVEDMPPGELGYQLLQELSKKSRPKLRTAKGDISLNLPEHLQTTKWLREPEKVELIGENYKRALEANEQLAKEHGLHLFASQWYLWDRMRRRVEPHENMFPGLERIPRPSPDQLKEANVAHLKSGHKSSTKEMVGEEGMFQLKPTRPGGDPSKYAYFGIAPPGGLLSAATGEEATPEEALSLRGLLAR
jgi:hypothetical protein